MHIFHTTSGFKRPNIARNTSWNCNFSLPFKNLPLKLHVIQTSLQKLGRNSLYYVFNISYFIHSTSNISGQQCMGLEAALAWKTCTFGLTKKLACKHCTVSFTKDYWTILRSLEVFLFQINRDNSGNSVDLILVDKCSVCYQIMEKKK